MLRRGGVRLVELYEDLVCTTAHNYVASAVLGREAPRQRYYDEDNPSHHPSPQARSL